MLHARTAHERSAPVRDPATLLARLHAQWGGPARPLGVRLCLADLAARVRRRRAPRRRWCTAGIARCACARASTAARRSMPGLVFALLPGGACRGWSTSLPRRACRGRTGAALGCARCPPASTTRAGCRCRTPQGTVPRAGLHAQPAQRSLHRPDLTDEELLHILRHARGRYGSTLEYLARDRPRPARARHPRPRDRAPDGAGPPPSPGRAKRGIAHTLAPLRSGVARFAFRVAGGNRYQLGVSVCAPGVWPRIPTLAALPQVPLEAHLS